MGPPAPPSPTPPPTPSCPGPGFCGTCAGVNLTNFCYFCSHPVDGDPVKNSGTCKGSAPNFNSPYCCSPHDDPERSDRACSTCKSGFLPCDARAICPPWTPPPTPAPLSYACTADKKCVVAPSGMSASTCATSCSQTYSCQRVGSFLHSCQGAINGTSLAVCKPSCQN